MTVTVSLAPETEALLRHRAAITGRDVSVLVAEAIEQAHGAPAEQRQSVADFDRQLDEFFAAHPEPVPPLPADFSRSDIYSDHD